MPNNSQCLLPGKSFLLITLYFLLTFSVAIAQNNPADIVLKKLKKIKDDDSSVTFAKSLIAAAHQKHDLLMEAKVLVTQSNRAYNKGDELKALDYGKQAMAIASEKDPKTYTRAATMVAYMMGRRGEDVEALKVAFAALKKSGA